MIGRASTFGFAFVNQCLSGAHGASNVLRVLRLVIGPHHEHGVVVARQQFYGVAMMIEAEDFSDGIASLA